KEDLVDWRFTGFIVYPGWNDKHLSWTNLYMRIKKKGDFNEIIYAHKKEGGKARPNSLMGDFRDCLGECGLEDMGCLVTRSRGGEVKLERDLTLWYVLIWIGRGNFLWP
uniref:Uncharacterized protein n=1 Tax=Aegilops tauschii subsp. strangulata TaxID=200361 RepID=A0A453FIQ5_AEGTS